MDSLRIDSGEIRLAVNDDPNRIIAFNPTDVGFAERFYKIVSDFEVKQQEYQARSAELDTAALSEGGLPANMEARLALLRETCDYLREKIDYVFGAGTSQKAFGDALVLDQFAQFFDGIAPYVRRARSTKIEQYIPKSQKPQRRTRRK